MTNRIAYRQGDVIIATIDVMPASEALRLHHHMKIKPDKHNRVVLAEGEVTGHAHVLENKGVTLMRPAGYPEGQSLLVVTETTVARGQLIEGKVIDTMPGGTLRFKMTDGTVMRFHPKDVDITKQGAVVKRAYSPLKHDEHDAIPLSKGVYHVIQQHTMVGRQRRVVND